MDTNKYKILIVDDEDDILEFLSYNLKNAGFQTFKAKNGREAIKKANEIIPNLILLDVMMPGMDGIETCERIKNTTGLKNTIIAFLTARGEDYSQIAGFEAGGDDYITKPIRPKVLLSRINALLKRYERYTNVQKENPPGGSLIQTDGLVIDLERYIVIKEGKELILPKKEFELLVLLIRNIGKVMTRDYIFDTIWGNDVVVGDRTIDVHIRKLREKIGQDIIKTIKGVGYKFVE